MFGSKSADFASAFADGFCHAWGDGKGGIGISQDRKRVALCEKGILKIYDRDQVRSHHCTVVTPGVVVGGGMQGSAHNIGAAIAAGKETGLFVRVKDIDAPVWRIPIKDDRTQVVWDEILLQWYEGVL